MSSHNYVDKKYLADRILDKMGIDKYDTSTVSGLINTLIRKTRGELSLGERYTFFPIKDPDMYRFYKKQETALWSSNEMDFSRDKNDYDKLSPSLQRVWKVPQAFFAHTDGRIVENDATRFLLESKTTEEQAFYVAKIFDEMVHSETYSLIINTIITDVQERNDLLMSVDHLPCVRAKDEWYEKYTMSELPISYRRLAEAAGEGIFFTSSFLFIFYFRSLGIMQNTIFANEQISKDEGLHRDVGIHLYKRDGVLSDDDAHELIKEAVELECAFVDEVLPESIDDLIPKDVKSFVEFLGDHLLISCGHEPLYEIKSSDLPSWMNDIAMEQKSNFTKSESVIIRCHH